MERLQNNVKQDIRPEATPDLTILIQSGIRIYRKNDDLDFQMGEDADAHILS